MEYYFSFIFYDFYFCSNLFTFRIYYYVCAYNQENCSFFKYIFIRAMFNSLIYNLYRQTQLLSQPQVSFVFAITFWKVFFLISIFRSAEGNVFLLILKISLVHLQLFHLGCFVIASRGPWVINLWNITPRDILCFWNPTMSKPLTFLLRYLFIFEFVSGKTESEMFCKFWKIMWHNV